MIFKEKLTMRCDSDSAQQEQSNCDRHVAGHCNRDKGQQNIATVTGMLQDIETVTGTLQNHCNWGRHAAGTLQP
jgi:hypothetical protein